jgi:ATP-binding cassette subfamily C protein CydD
MKIALFRHIPLARRFLLVSVVLSVVGTGVLIVQMVLLSGIVNAVFLAHAGLAQVMLPLVGFLLALLTRAALIWGREVITQRGAIQVKAALRQRLFSHLLQLGPIFSRGEHAGELTTTLNEGVERLDAYVSRYVPQTILSVVIPLLIVAVVFPLDWISALLLLVTAPIIPILMMLVGSYAEKHVQQQWEALGRLGAHLLDSIQGLTTLKLFGRSKAEQVQVGRLSESFRAKTMQVLRYAFLSGGVLEFLTAMAIGVVAVVLGVRLIDHLVSFQKAFLVLLLTPEFYRPLQELGAQRHAAMEGKAAAQRMVTLLETPLPIATSSTSVVSKIRAGELTLQLTDVTCTYPGSETPALKGVSLFLPAHSCTALVGRSGAGKSTLVNVLLRFIDYESGCIEVNGLALKDIPVEEWRKYVALVPQHPYLFYGTVRENIRMAREEASDAEVRQAAALAGCDFIDQLPQGFETQLGEQGLRLSAGQAQRLALARAFLKDAPLLILDEPTSGLDVESEVLIEQAIARLIERRTVLVIAHRYNTIRRAQQVAVMEDGQIAEYGKPEQLLRDQGIYAHLMQMVGKE